ncbi:MAG: MarR family transcriptional regulator [Bacteroidetes bacterium]|jgi:DNA-binding MarR family transcriptional regulator|nr:MarR family transcriptional regulator [Bacteroidota bacterium]
MNTTDIIIKIRKIVRSINLESKKIQKEYGVSIPQILCLNFLQKSTNYQSTQNEIRQFLNLNSSTVTGIVNRLENKGLVARLPKNDQDRRVVNIILTSKGDKLISEIPSLMHEKLDMRLKELPEEQLLTILGSLNELIGLLNIETTGADEYVMPIDDMLESNITETEITL